VRCVNGRLATRGGSSSRPNGPLQVMIVLWSVKCKSRLLNG
jgi:hypothetical protein